MFMKIKSLMLVAAMSPAMLAFGQTAVFYNQGKMSVKATDPSATVLYIQGDFVAGDNDTKTTTSDIKMEKSRIVLTGDFRHNALTEGAKVFDVESTPDAVFEFRGDTKQKITTNGKVYSEIPNKGSSYIAFPTLEINNRNQVHLDAALAVQATNLNLTKGTFVLDAERITKDNIDKYLKDNLASSAENANPDERSALAHLKVSNNITYVNMLTPDSADRSFVRVIVPFDKEGYSKENGRFASIVGMGIPFQGLHTDYFFWNYVMQPSNDNYFGPNNMPLNDKNNILKPGVGYIIGNNLRGNVFDDYIDNNTSTSWVPGTKAQFDARFNTEYVFDRAAFAAIPNSNARFNSYSEGGVYYTEEKLNSSDVQIQLEKGFNYLANPFTSPLDISALLNDASTVVDPQWNVKVGSVRGQRDIMNRVWIMKGTSRGSAKDNMLYPGSPMAKNDLQLEVNFYLAKTTGSTYTDGGGTARTLIPALQMFLVYAEKDVTITIPRSAQAMGENTFIRSANLPYDDLVFEVVDVKTKTSDRTSVVLRSKAEMISNTDYSNVRKMNSVVNLLSTSNNELNQGVSSQLYTLGDSSEPLTVKYLGYTPNVDSKISTPLNLKPSILDQDIIIRGYRLETLRNFESVILVDKLLGKEVVMTPETEYKTTIKPTDSEDRFVLVFSRGTDGIEDEIENTSKSIKTYYANGTLTVTGFEETDFGSVVTVYDLQGRQVAQTKVEDFTVNITANFLPGAFVVKVVGNNSYVSKFLVK